MKTNSKVLLTGLLTIIILLVTTSMAFCTQLSEPTTWTQLEGLPLQMTLGRDVAVNKDSESYMISTSSHDGIFESFLYKYSATGTRVWKQNFGVKTAACAVAVDSAKNSYVTGYTNADLEDVKLTGKCDAFIIKYQPDGAKAWVRLIGVPDAITVANDIVIDKANNFYIVGYTTGNLNNQVLTGEQDLLIAKYNSEGVHQWTRLLGGRKTKAESKKIVIDHNNNLYIVGETTGNLDGQKINKKVSLDTFIVKYDSLGNKKWTQLFKALSGTNKKPGFANGSSIAIDSHGNCYISGYTSDQTPPSYLYNVYIRAYTPDGKELWRKLIPLRDYAASAASIIIDSLDNLYLCFSSYAEIENTILIGLADAYLLKYNTLNQNLEWVKQLGVMRATISVVDIVIDKNNLLYVAGTTNAEIESAPITGSYDAFISTYFNK